MWGSFFYLRHYLPVELRSQNYFFFFSPLHAVLPSHTEWLVIPVHWVFPVFLDLINVTSMVTSPSPRTFFTGELHIRLFTTVWVTNEVVHCLQITLGWNKIIVFRSIKNGHGDILKLSMMTLLPLLLQAVLRLQALRPLNIHINKSGLTAPDKTTVYGDGTDLETSPYQSCDKGHCKIG